jgi:hypothetical protein
MMSWDAPAISHTSFSMPSNMLSAKREHHPDNFPRMYFPGGSTMLNPFTSQNFWMFIICQDLFRNWGWK